MVGRSSEISRESCRVQDVDDVTVNDRSEGHCVTNGPESPLAQYRASVGNEHGGIGEFG
jgi:hypothetical protein